jgi:hypothetical protein
MLRVEQLTCVPVGGVTPFDSDISVSHVDYGPTLTLGDCNAPALGGRTFTISTSASAGLRTRLVTSAVADDFANRATRGSRSQWRFHTTRTGQPNMCIFATQNNGTKHPSLRVTYEFD